MKLLRKYSLTVGTPENQYTTTEDGVLTPRNAVEITDLNIEFTIDKSDDSSKTLNSAKIKIYNLSEETIGIVEKEDSVVILEAGWEDDSYGLVFQGDIVTYDTIKSGSDYITEIECADGYLGIREAITHKTYPADTSVQAVLMDLIKGEAGDTVYYTATGAEQGTRPPIGLGLSIGEMSGLGLFDVFENGLTISKPTKQAIDDICYAHRLKWSIQDSKVYVTNLNGDEQYKYTVPVISEETGLIDTPKKIRTGVSKRKGDKTPVTGYSFSCTLNHEIIPEMFINLVAEDIDVVAKVKKVTHIGQYEGASWDTDVECIIQDF